MHEPIIDIQDCWGESFDTFSRQPDGSWLNNAAEVEARTDEEMMEFLARNMADFRKWSGQADERRARQLRRSGGG